MRIFEAMRLTLILIAALVLSSCASTVSTRTSKTMDIYGPGVIHHPVLVDLDVKETKVTGSTTIINSSSEENGKRLAVIEALKDSGADVLVQPVYQIETKGSRTTYTVTGFPATYKNFRPMTPQDIPLVQAGVLQRAEVTEPKVASKPKGRGAAIFFSVLLSIGVAVALVLASQPGG